MAAEEKSSALAWAHKVWNQYAAADAAWAVLATHDMQEFWDSGEREIGALEKAGLISKTDRVADLGAGMGRLSRALARRVREVYSLDVSSQMLERLRSHAGDTPNLHTFLVEGDRLPDGEFDKVVSFLVLQHMPTQVARRTLTNLAAKLTADGQMLIDLPIHEWELGAGDRHNWNALPASELWESRHYTFEEAQELLFAPAGLEVEKVVSGIRGDRKVIVLRKARVPASVTAAARVRAAAREARFVAERFFLEFPKPRPAFMTNVGKVELFVKQQLRPRVQQLARRVHELAFPREAELRSLLTETLQALEASSAHQVAASEKPAEVDVTAEVRELRQSNGRARATRS